VSELLNIGGGEISKKEAILARKRGIAALKKHREKIVHIHTRGTTVDMSSLNEKIKLVGGG